MPLALLNSRILLRLSGDDTIPFLQGLISNDAAKLAKDEAIYAALLTPQGKFLHDFFLVPSGGSILLDIAEARAEDLIKRLKIYKLRSKVEIEMVPELVVAAIWGGTDNVSVQDITAYQDPRSKKMGLRILAKKDDVSALILSKSLAEVSEDEYHQMRLSHSVPDTYDMIVEKSLLLECGFEELHGVDFAKGCYVGQEVTARSKFRGQVRKAFYKVTGLGVDSLPATGTEIKAGEAVIGQIRTSQGAVGLAIIKTDEYERVKNARMDISCNGVQINVTPAEWLQSLAEK